MEELEVEWPLREAHDLEPVTALPPPHVAWAGVAKTVDCRTGQGEYLGLSSGLNIIMIRECSLAGGRRDVAEDERLRLPNPPLLEGVTWKA